MREVLFRGKQIDNGDWIEGYYLKADWNGKEIHAIIPQNTVLYSGNTIDSIIEIDPKTLCQYTGMNDKKGKWIWENDIVSINTYDYMEPQEDFFGQVIYAEGCGCWCIQQPKDEKPIPLCECEGSYQTDIFVYGNAFDNPELMKGE